MKKVCLVSLGCAKNRIDSEMILAMFPADHFVLTNDKEEADLIIINTCGFIESAKRESIDVILEHANCKGKLVICGCLATRYEEELRKEFPEADLVISINDYPRFAREIEKLIGEKLTPMNPIRRILTTSKFSAYIRISDGCNHFCSFCAIPLIRGRFHSRPFDEIIEEAKLLKEKGIKELSVISQDTTLYGSDFKGKHPNIIDLLKALEAVGFASIRLLYLYPSEITDELITYIASSNVIAHYFDVPIQTASNRILKLMHRLDDAESTRKLLHRIRALCPDAIIRTTLIAGFSGETKADHEKAKALLEEIRFDHMGVFAYSVEEGTFGETLPHRVRETTKQKRVAELMEIQKRVSYQLNKQRIGQIHRGIVIASDPSRGRYLLRSHYNAPDDIDGEIRLHSDIPLAEGDMVLAKITEAFVYDLQAEFIEKID